MVTVKLRVWNSKNPRLRSIPLAYINPVIPGIQIPGTLSLQIDPGDGHPPPQDGPPPEQADSHSTCEKG
jgi:hypothetical protein